jgi:hypothetical protein
VQRLIVLLSQAHAARFGAFAACVASFRDFCRSGAGCAAEYGFGANHNYRGRHTRHSACRARAIFLSLVTALSIFLSVIAIFVPDLSEFSQGN